MRFNLTDMFMRELPPSLDSLGGGSGGFGGVPSPIPAQIPDPNLPPVPGAPVVPAGGGEPPAPVPATPAPAPAPVEPAKTPEQTAEEERVAAEAAAAAEKEKTEGGGEGDNPLAFFEEVEKLSGIHVDVDYGKPGTDDYIEPSSPEGVKLREDAVRDQAVQGFEKYLKETNPRGYAYLVHLASGGSDEDFMQQPGGFVLPTMEELNGSVDLQKAMFEYDQRSRGVDEEIIQMAVEKAIKDNKLLEKSTASYNTIKQAQDSQLQEAENYRNQQAQTMQAAVAGVTKQINNAIDNEIAFLVPDADKVGFSQFVMNNIQYDGKDFHIVQKLSGEELKAQLESLLFQYKKGDLAKVAMRQTGTKAAQTLRLKLEKAKQDKLPDQGIGGSGGKKLTLGEV